MPEKLTDQDFLWLATRLIERATDPTMAVVDPLRDLGYEVAKWDDITALLADYRTAQLATRVDEDRLWAGLNRTVASQVPSSES